MLGQKPAQAGFWRNPAQGERQVYYFHKHDHYTPTREIERHNPTIRAPSYLYEEKKKAHDLSTQLTGSEGIAAGRCATRPPRGLTPNHSTSARRSCAARPFRGRPRPRSLTPSIFLTPRALQISRRRARTSLLRPAHAESSSSVDAGLPTSPASVPSRHAARRR